ANDRALTGRSCRNCDDFAALFAETYAPGGGFVPRQNSERISAGGRVEIIVLGSSVNPDDIGAQLRSVLGFRGKEIEATRREQNFGGRKPGGASQTHKGEINLPSVCVIVLEYVFNVGIGLDLFLFFF